MTSLTTPRPNPSAIQQWWVLTARVVVPTLRNGELVIAIAISAVFTVSFYLPLNHVMSTVVAGSYGQYLMPLITVTAIYFASMSAAIRSATDSVEGIDRRFRSMPIASATPLAARLSANVYRCAIALVIAILCGHFIGFRFYRGVACAVVFCLLVLLIGVALSLVGDLIGVVSTNPEATPYILLLPQMTLGYLSVGLQPAAQFPEWIQPFVRNQPISQFVAALRELAGDATEATGAPNWWVVVPSLGWIAGLTATALLLHVAIRGSGDRVGAARFGPLRTAAVVDALHEDAGLPLYDSVAIVAAQPVRRRFLRETAVLTQRLLVRWARDPQTVIQALALPVVFLVTLNLVFGETISAVSQHNALYGSVPMTALVAAVFGSSAAGIGLMRERDEGFLARLWVLPIRRASSVLSRLVAEVVRISISSVVVAAVGLALGLRFQQGIFATLAWLFVPVLFGVGFSFLVITLALWLANRVLAEATGLLVALMVFFCTGFVPAAQYPGWIQPLVEHQPMSYAVDAMRGLSVGGAVMVPMLGTLLWSAGIVLTCAAPMVMGYRAASMR
ncbi:MAG: ABC transporter permease [Mycolicibacterium sp.]|uniref:ABC transporter permease n=1 Tax=Mycolicibacterium sp. TaxID=2320850 RepID=UPI003D10DC03